ncbi:MAG: tetratricopeptide repeat protein [Lishizhenia sp.]
MRINRIIQNLICIAIILVIVVSCSTEKNTFVNRTYHNTTARFNGYFNATELVRIGLESYRNGNKEDYYSILPIEELPNEEEAVSLYPAMDTAIAKCSEVISKHSMPTMEKLSKKKEEYCKWIDENWMLIGKSEYYKGKYAEAYDNFDFVKKFYRNNPSTHAALLWMAKCDIKMGDLTKANLKLKKLDKAEQDILFAKKNEKKKSRLKNVKKKSEEVAEFPKGLALEIAKTKAVLALEKEDYTVAIEKLKEAVVLCHDAQEKARLNFIIGQILQEQNSTDARMFYTASIKRNANYEMAFHARINRALAGGEGDEKIVKELNKMLRDEKNSEFKDQIYYALADIELDKGDQPLGMSYLTQSVFYSLNNNRQKGVSYERMGDISFKDKNYINAQKYYDSSANVLPETYEKKEEIRNKADKLFDLVTNLEVIQFEDSVQRIASLSEKERAKFIKDVIKQIEEEKKRKAEVDARRLEELRQLQQELTAQNNGQGGKWYFNNSKAMAEGFNEFRRIYGQRENEDNWRRSNKVDNLVFIQNDTIPADTLIVEEPTEELTVETLLKNIPLTDSALAESNNRLIESYYASGMLYQNQLNEIDLAQQQFDAVLNKNIENRHNLLSAYQLYKINEQKDASKANDYKTYIFNNYPNSDYANFLRDPNFFIKQKELAALELKEYLKSVERFEQGLFYPVITKANKVIESEPNNIYRSKYLLLKAMAMGEINPDKQTLLPVLEQILVEYPESDEAPRAKELKDLLINGIPENIPVDFSKPTTIYSYSNSDQMYVMIYLSEKDDNRASRTKVSDFNREFFSRERYSTTSQIISTEKGITVVMVKDMEDKAEADEYLRVFKRTKKHLGDFRNAKIQYISKENFKILIQQQKLKEYDLFFQDNY